MRVNHQELYEITERDTIYKPWDDKHDVLGEQAVNDIVEAQGLEIEEG